MSNVDRVIAEWTDEKVEDLCRIIGVFLNYLLKGRDGYSSEKIVNLPLVKYVFEEILRCKLPASKESIFAVPEEFSSKVSEGIIRASKDKNIIIQFECIEYIWSYIKFCVKTLKEDVDIDRVVGKLKRIRKRKFLQSRNNPNKYIDMIDYLKRAKQEAVETFKKYENNPNHRSYSFIEFTEEDIDTLRELGVKRKYIERINNQIKSTENLANKDFDNQTLSKEAYVEWMQAVNKEGASTLEKIIKQAEKKILFNSILKNKEFDEALQILPSSLSSFRLIKEKIEEETNKIERRVHALYTDSRINDEMRNKEEFFFTEEEKNFLQQLGIEQKTLDKLNEILARQDELENEMEKGSITGVSELIEEEEQYLKKDFDPAYKDNETTIATLPSKTGRGRTVRGTKVNTSTEEEKSILTEHYKRKKRLILNEAKELLKNILRDIFLFNSKSFDKRIEEIEAQDLEEEVQERYASVIKARIRGYQMFVTQEKEVSKEIKELFLRAVAYVSISLADWLEVQVGRTEVIYALRIILPSELNNFITEVDSDEKIQEEFSLLISAFNLQTSSVGGILQGTLDSIEEISAQSKEYQRYDNRIRFFANNFESMFL